jgi:hypothetical protein
LLFPGEATYALKSLEFPNGLPNATIMAVTALELYLGWVLALKQDLRRSLAAAMVLMFAFRVFSWYFSTLAHPPFVRLYGIDRNF